MSLKIPIFIGVLWFPAAALWAIPQNLGLFCGVYSEAPKCQESAVTCQTCHQIPPSLNPYGDYLKQLLQQRDDYAVDYDFFKTYLPQAFADIADSDSDGDGYPNRLEIKEASEPGDPMDFPDTDPPSDMKYNPSLALRRIALGFCGQSPAFADMEDFRQAEDQEAYLHHYLDRCLQSEFWLEGALPRLGDAKIRPNASIGADGNPFVIGDYRYDYRLFTHVLSGDRDARELLTADYHITPEGEKVSAPIPSKRVPGRIVVGNGQPLIPERRAGMMTTQWFLSTNTMFAILPRNTAAQAYRAYLGLDIAKSEGLVPVAGEPRDVDNKGVTAPACAVCHSTLDPLAYAFSAYNGLLGGAGGEVREVGAYNPQRTPWENDGYLWGQPVADLMEWRQLAIESDEFKQNITQMFYEYAVGRLPQTDQEKKDFRELWQGFATADQYQAERLIHRLIETLSFAGVTP